MSYQDVIADIRRITVFDPRHRPVAMDDAAVLDIGAGTNDDAVYLSADNAIIPDAGPCADGNIANDPATWRDKGAVVDLRRLAVDRNDADIGSPEILGDHSRFFQSDICGRTEA